jgi:hypothetical protein
MATATIQAKFTLTANAQDTSGTTKYGSATISASFTLSATGGGGSAPAAQILTTFSLVTAGGAAGLILQQVQGTSTSDYGCTTVEIETTPGSCLVVVAGWDLSTSPTDAPMPAVYVTDSAANPWIHVATTPATVTGSRSAAWICMNAASIEWLSVSLTTFCSSMCFLVLELNGNTLPQFYSLDALDAVGNSSAAELVLNPGTATDADFAFAVVTTGGYTAIPIIAGGPEWQALTSVSSTGGGSLNQTQIFPFIAQAAPGTTLATTFGLPQAIPVSGIVFAIHSTVYPPIVTNISPATVNSEGQLVAPAQNFPLLKVEAGFGSTPGDLSQAPPVWTDITSRVIAPVNQASIKSSTGRQYELAQAEAGTLEIWVDNHTGDFTPGNPNSVYWPNVVLETPVRVSAYWDGSWYPVAFGWVERWPQEWPDLPQWGISKMIATDAISVAAAGTMLSALDNDILLDSPYVLINCAEQYLSFSNGLSGGSGITAVVNGVLGTYTNSDAEGLLAQNWSRVNQRAGMYVDGNGAATGGQGNAIASTGQSTNLLGSSNTGFGTSAVTAVPNAPASGPGIIYTDPNMPSPQSPNGVTVSFWVIVEPQTVGTQVQPTVFTAYGPPSNYQPQYASLSVQILNFTGGNTLQVTLADGSTTTAAFNPSATAQTITLCVTSFQLQVYVNGALALTQGLTAGQTTTWSAMALGNPDYAYQSGGLTVGNFTAFGWAQYDYQLAPQRIGSQYSTGLFGQQNVDAVTRMAQILAWANLGIPRGGQITFGGVTDGVLQGPAYSLSGQTAADALNQVVTNNLDMIAAMPTGSLVYFHRWALYNQSPAAIFSDDPDSGTDIPYLNATAFDYDNTYLNNSVQYTQQYGANNLFTVTTVDPVSQGEYYARAASAVTITTMSNLDAYDDASWFIAKYSQPSLRVSGLVVDAASNPQVAFPSVLQLQLGQAAQVIRTPVGGAQITGTVLVQKVSHAIGPTMWQTAYQMSPYVPEDAVLQLDATGFDVVGNNSLG